MLERFNARDASSNGRFLTGVRTTGIYCLPSCPARRPKPENTAFYESEADARAAGLRPCKRCRPDAFYAGRDPERELLDALAELLRERVGDVADARDLARRLGVGATRLAEFTRRHRHETPGQLLARARVEAVARELASSHRSPLAIALDAGFESSSTLHENFKRAYALSPGAYRKLVHGDSFTLELPADLRKGDLLSALGRDPDSPTERVDGFSYARALVLEGRPALLAVQLAKKSAKCRVTASRPVGPEGMVTAHRTALRLLGLAADPGPFERRARREAAVRRVVGARRGLRVPLTTTVSEALAWAVIGQQINLAFAFALRRRVIELAGRRAPGGLRTHPTPAELARLDPADLAPLQFSARKAATLVETARLVQLGALAVEQFASGSAVHAEQQLLAVKGIGPWTANYVLMRGAEFADCVPVGDSGLATALGRLHDLGSRPDADATRTLMEPFAPHRSLATFHLWRSLGDPA